MRKKSRLSGETHEYLIDRFEKINWCRWSWVGAWDFYIIKVYYFRKILKCIELNRTSWKVICVYMKSIRTTKKELSSSPILWDDFKKRNRMTMCPIKKKHPVNSGDQVLGQSQVKEKLAGN